MNAIENIQRRFFELIFTCIDINQLLNHLCINLEHQMHQIDENESILMPKMIALKFYKLLLYLIHHFLYLCLYLYKTRTVAEIEENILFEYDICVMIFSRKKLSCLLYVFCR